jgi:hypothetical protein
MSGYFDRWICEDCGVELDGTGYMVRNDLWLSVMPQDDGHLCLLCLEDRLGRLLDPERDFSPAPINDYIVEKLDWVHRQGREALLEMSRQRRERLDRRSAQRRARREKLVAEQNCQHS